MADKLTDPSKPAHEIIEVLEDGDAIRNDGVRLQAANKNPWYVLATIYGEQEEGEIDQELAVKNRRAWNGWYCGGLSDEARAKKTGLELEELGPLSKVELAEIKKHFAARMGKGAQLPQNDGTIDFSKAIFSKPLSFEHYVFEQNVSFDCATFDQNASYTHACFRNGISCESAVFNGFTTFLSTVFVDYAGFRSARFGDNVNFSYAAFRGEADFAFVSFENEAVFDESRFENEAKFDLAEFCNHAKFEFTEFFNRTTFNGTTFETCADFKSARFNEAAEFERVKFGIWGRDHADFSSAIFSENVSFNGSQYKSTADFSSAKFCGNASFDAVEFGCDALFRGTKFIKDALFFEAKFMRCAQFQNASFGRYISFSSAKFKSKTRFGDGMKLANGARFLTAVPEFHAAELFDDTVFPIPNKYTDNWPPIKSDKSGAKIEGQDEPVNVMDAEDQKRAYNRLRLFMNRSLQIDEEQFFHRMEMRCKREIETSKTMRLLYGIFEWVSKYGSSVLRPLIGLVLLIVIGTPLMLGYLSWDDAANGAYFWEALGWSISNSLPFLGFGKVYYSGYAAGLPVWFKVLGGLQTVLGFILLFFFGLGLRNRFRLR